MSGITTGIGIFSGIDTATLIEQLLAVEARPRQLAQRRIVQLQAQQGAYLDINSKLGALQSSVRRFRTEFIFDSMKGSSSNADVLSAQASRTAVPGSYAFIVDRLVSSQQMLSRGFTDADTSAVGASSFTFESVEGRLDRDVALADLNDGDGVKRGKIQITQGSASATVDLSKAATVNDVLDAINDAGLDVQATARDGGFVLTGGTDFTVSNASGSTTATSLGIAGNSSAGTLTGSTVYRMTGKTTLTQLNDGNGVFIGTDVGESRYDFTINVEVSDSITTAVRVNLGSVWETVDGKLEETAGAVKTVQGVIDRINAAIEDAGLGSAAEASVSNGRIVLTNNLGRDLEVVERNGTSSTARNLGLEGTATGTMTGDPVLAGLNTTLVGNLNGGDGLAGDGLVSFTARDGASFTVDVSGARTVAEIVRLINEDGGNGGRLTASLNNVGNGLRIADQTGGSGNLIIEGETAASLGLETDPSGVAESRVEGTSLQHKYVAMATRVETLNNGAGIGTGVFRITDGNGIAFSVDIGSDTKTVYDLVREMQGQADAAGANINVRINDNGDGLLIEEKTGEPDGGTTIRVEDVSGQVAKKLRLAGTASGTGDENVIDGSAETRVEFEATDTLNEIVQKINDATGTPVRATILNDGTGSNPFRLSLSARESGTAGRFILDDNGLGLDLTTLDAGDDARVFYGSSDPASAVLLSSSSNTLDSVIPGVTIDLNRASDEVVNLTISRDSDRIITAVEEFIKAYNETLKRIDHQTRYDSETEVRGPLLGDSTLSILRSSLSRTSLAEPIGVDDDFSRLSEVGITVGTGGNLELDRDKFRGAMEQDFQAVRDLLAAREEIPQDSETEIDDGIFVRNRGLERQFSRLGVLFQFEELSDTYLDSVDGILTGRDGTINDQIKLQEQRIEQFTVLLELKRQRLQAQFLAMEEALASLQSQQSSLASLAGLIQR